MFRRLLSSGIFKDIIFPSDMHYKCRNGVYPDSTIERFFVPDDKVSWKEKYPEYNPPTYTSPSVFSRPWADPDIGKGGFSPQWNSDDGVVNRLCGSHKYGIDMEGYPINPVGRTGLRGRGLLGRWGSNCAGDCIATRWKREASMQIIYDKDTGKGLLEFLAIKRKDCGEWAIPGGFADQSEDFMQTVQREFFEETLNQNVGYVDLQSNQNISMGEFGFSNIREKLDEIFKNGKVVYSGYVDDHRNTDQAWISTNAVNVHDDLGTVFNAITFNAGDDAAEVMWMEVNTSMQLYANHKLFVQATAELLGAHF